jgi:type I restriction enzyme, S subunit
MTWGSVKIGRLCGRTGTTDPRRKPNVSFRYIDISGIDRELKRIATTTEIAGAEAPSRARQVVKANDVLVSTVRPNLNAVAMVPAELDGEIASTGFSVLRAIESVLEPRYLFYFTRTEQFISALLQHVRGANYPAVTDRNVLDVEIPWPAKSEQHRITEILDQADALRQQRCVADDKAQRVLPVLFHKFFGDPLRNTKGWPLMRFDKVADSRLGKMLDAKQQTGQHSRPYLRNANVQWNRFDLREVLEMDFAPAEREEFRLQMGDLLICEGGEVGRCAIWRDELPECYFQKALHRARPIKGKATSEYLLYLFWALASQDGLSDATSQVTIAHLTGIKLKQMMIPVAPYELQRTFSTIVQQAEPMFAERDCCGERIERMFDVLLHRAFTGDLTAGWREKHKLRLEAEMREQLAALERPRGERPNGSREKRITRDADSAPPERHAGHDMFNKAALVTYIVTQCHDPARPNTMGRTKIAKLFYLVQRRAEISLTQQFARRAAGPLDDAIHKFLNLAKKNGWLELPFAKGKLKPVVPGRDPQPAIEHVRQRWAAVLPAIDQMLDTMKGWGWEALERWATVEHAAQNILAEGKPVTLETIKAAIASCPEWRQKLDRPAFSDSDIQSTLMGLRKHGFLPALASAKC